jgi:taurine dioxygenase
VHIRPLTSCIGAEVGGVDLGAELDDGTVAALRQGLLDHLVLFFRDQDISPGQQLRFAEKFAPVMLPLIDTLSTEQPGVTVLDTDSPKGQYTEYWHTDSTFLAAPPLGAVLRAVKLPSLGGDTCWASMYAAYDALSPTMQSFLEPLTAVHSMEILDAALNAIGGVVRRDGDIEPATHPVVRVHPETGRKLLFVNRNFTTRIAELSAAESRTLLALLFAHINTPAFHVRFRWQPNSVAFWDNRATQHCAIPDYDERRVMNRCLLQGDRPIGVRRPLTSDRPDHQDTLA